MKNHLFFLSIIIGLFTSHYSFAQLDTINLCVLTYNIYHGENPYNPGNANIVDIADVINSYHPDFVALQEVDSMTQRSTKFNNGTKKI
ncbi:MAG: endonuclease/exonuclease/phosphatase family protein [Bacteroidales bacterium]|nr:endonuclease/exonuclease/phosphatase family protein [Bacteroidales bacterium]